MSLLGRPILDTSGPEGGRGIEFPGPGPSSLPGPISRPGMGPESLPGK